MNREQAIQEIKARISCKDYLERSRKGGRGMYNCPQCGSGTGNHGTGALKFYEETNTVYCHACGYHGDVIDLYQRENGADFNTAITLLAQDLGITIDPGSDFYEPNEAPDRPRKAPAARGAENGAAEEGKGPAADYTEYYRECTARLTDPAALSYLQSRGISLETARAYSLGYDPAADPANAPGAAAGANKPHPVPRIIIPSCSSHYVGRRIDGGEDYAKINSAGSSPGIFNEAVLYAQEVQNVFVTEGTFDALAILEAGYPAIALNSTSNWEKLTENLRARREETNCTLILCLDNDKAGKAATDSLQNTLPLLEIPSITADICGGCKDPNEALTKDRKSFLTALQDAVRAADHAAKPDNTAAYIDNLMAAELNAFRQQDLKTGFSNLDKEAQGLYSGLYILAAGSSLGKTTFALQMADQLAAAGTDVIYFSLEQSRLELVTKSISRFTAQQDLSEAVKSINIRKGWLSKSVLDATKAYKEAVGDRINIIEGNFDTDVSAIGNYVRRYISRNNVRPVVIVDYLQILQPPEDMKRATTKEVMDFTVTELKRLSRDLGIVIICIGSLNRANYLLPVDFESLKESGAIEYSADVVWGLQLMCLNEELFSKEGHIKEKRARIKEEKKAIPRRIELVCLKNRFGTSSYSCYFNYDPRFDLFTEATEAAADFTPTGRTPKAGRKL